MKIMAVVVLFSLLSMCACDDYVKYDLECKIGTVRCYENKAQYCNYQEYWQTINDCGEAGLTCYYDYTIDSSGIGDIVVCSD